MSNTVNRGQQPNDQQADTLYTAFGKVNDKFSDHDDLKQVQDASEKETPVDADSLPLIDSAAAVETPKLKWLSWAKIKATLKVYFDTLYNNLGLGETQTTAYRGDRGKTGYDHSQTAHAPSNATAAGETGDAHAATAHAPSNATANDTDANLKARGNHTGTQLAATISNFADTVRATVLTGLSLTTNAAIAATDTVLSALGKLQKQITDHFTTHPAPTNRDTRNEAANANIQTHVTSAHAPSNAQKNSDITKAEIEAKLTDLISSHGHNLISGSHNWSGGILWWDINKTNGHLVRYSHTTDYSFEVGSDDLPTNSVLFFIQTGVGKLSITSSGSITVGGTASSNGLQTGFMLRKNSPTHWDSFPFGGSGGGITGLTANKIPRASSASELQDSNLEHVPTSNNLTRVGGLSVTVSSPDENSLLVSGKLYVGDGEAVSGQGAQSGNFNGAIKIGDGNGSWPGTIKYISNDQDFQAYQGSAWKSIINANITKEEIEAKLTGAISSHTHNAADHVHGAITNVGGIATGVTPASGDRILISDDSNGGLIRQGSTFGTLTTQYLRNNGTWGTPPNTTYLEISEAEINAGTASSFRTITGRRAGYIKKKPGTYGTAAPSGGGDGDVYFQYE